MISRLQGPHHRHRYPPLFSFLLLALLASVVKSFRVGVPSASSSSPHRYSSSSKRITFLFLAPQQLGSFEELQVTDHEKSTRRVALYDYSNHSHPIPFETAWDWQKQLLEEQVVRLTANIKENENNPTSSFVPQQPQNDNDSYSTSSTNTITTIPPKGVDSIIMIQHAPVYTLGTGSDESFILNNDSNDNTSSIPTIRMDRGGEVTYHGPGQLTIYPILDLREYNQDIHWYMRALEQAVMLAIQRITGIICVEPQRQDDITGVWIDDHKVAAVGIKCRKWITMHGVAINVTPTSLEHFQGIVPCGLEGRKVGCLEQFLVLENGTPLSVSEFATYMQEALQDVFQMTLVPADTTRFLE